MVFCLFREADTPDFYFAVNASHVNDVEVRGHVLPPLCLINLPISTGDYLPLTPESYDDVNKALRQAAKIGLNKVEAQVLTGTNARPVPLLLNNPDRIVFIRQLRPEEFKTNNECASASQMFFKDGTSRLIAGRPGTFAFLANADGKVPGV